MSLLGKKWGGNACRGCVFSFKCPGGYACQYILMKKKGWPCLPGAACVVREDVNMPRRNWDAGRALELVNEGKDDVAIADAVGTTVEVIKSWRKNNRIKLQKPAAPEIERAQSKPAQSQPKAKPAAVKAVKSVAAPVAPVAKADAGKLRLSLVPPELIRAVGEIREYGLKKYGDPENWRRVEAQRYWDAALRHALAAWNDYTAVDPESGMPHIWHMACNLGFLIQLHGEEEKT